MKNALFILAVMAALCAGQISNADEKMVVMVPAALDPNAPIGDAVSANATWTRASQRRCLNG